MAKASRSEGSAATRSSASEPDFVGTAAVPVLLAKLRAPRPTGLMRRRLLEELERVWASGLGLVVAPAGSGKTTLLAQVAASVDAPVAWYRAESSEAEPEALFAHLHRAILGSDAPPWRTVEEAAAALQALSPARLLIVIDDLHTLGGTPAEDALHRLAGYLPPTIALLIGTRRPPDFDLERLRLDDRIVELGTNDLRFRTWEVEELFRGQYGARIAPEQLAELTRRTEGWVAGLQFFHLATRGKPAGAQARLLTDLTGRSDLFRSYLARNVIADLPPTLRTFMVRTSPLGWLDGSVCDAFLDRCGSEDLLEEAEARQVFTERVGTDSYRYHEVLRSLLDDVLVDEIGEDAARMEHRRAGQLLEDAGRQHEALRAYGRAEDWASLARLADAGAESDLPVMGFVIPPGLGREPWALLAGARALLRGGRVAEAVQRYAEAEQAFGRARGADSCSAERVAAAAWLDRVSGPTPGWSGVVRRATRDHPLAAGNDCPSGPNGDLARGLALLLAGRIRSARSVLAEVAEADDSSRLSAAGARLAEGIACLLAGEPVAKEGLLWAVEVFESEIDWLAQLTWAVAQSGQPGALRDADAARGRCQATGNDWGRGLAGVIEVLLWFREECSSAPEASAVAAIADEAATIFHGLGASVLAVWADAARATALARAGHPDAASAARRADRRAAATGSDLARHQALCALIASGAADSRQSRLCSDLATAHGLAAAATGAATGIGTSAGISDVGPSLEVRCFAGLSIVVDGRPVDLTSAKPRVRSLLRLLAVSAGRPVHREAIAEALWPDQDGPAANRSLQVGVSALRQLLEPGVLRGLSGLVVRNGDGYALVLGPEGRADVVEFEELIGAGRRTQRAGDPAGAAVAFAAALELYRGELLPEEGAAEWVVKVRQRFEMEAADAAAALGECALAQGDVTAAIDAFERCLRIDPYRDGVWRQLIAAGRGAGDRVAAGRAAARYEEMLRELDLVGEGSRA